MTIEDQRARQRQAQQTAIEQRRSSEGISRIGPRDPETGRYNVISPDGSTARDGLKIFTAEAVGTPVLATPRTDGLRTIDNLKGADTPKTPQPLAPAKLYREGRVFEIPEQKKGTKGPIHILFVDEGKLWVGGHQDDPEEVLLPIVAGNPTLTYDLWADNSGWIVTRRSTNPSILQSYDSEGAFYSSPAHPDNQFWTIPNLTGGGFIGFGMVSLQRSVGLGFQMARALWLRGTWAFNWAAAPDPNFVLEIPVAMFPPLTITRVNENIDDLDAAYTKEYLAVARDRTSTLVFYAFEDYFSGDLSGYHELIQSNGTAQQIWSWSGTPIYKPTGMYTDGAFTRVLNVTEINNLKSGDGLVNISTTQLDRTTTTTQVQGVKIPATAIIEQYVVALS